MKFLQPSEDSRNFLKLKAGESIQGVFRGEIYDFRIHWADSRSSVCAGKDICELCKSGNKSSFRFRVNFVTKEATGYVAKLIEQGWNFYGDMRSLNEGGYELEKFVVKITRQGEGLHTKYTILPLPNGLLTASSEALISKVTLNNLAHIAEIEAIPETVENPLATPKVPETYEDIPF